LVATDIAFKKLRGLELPNVLPKNVEDLDLNYWRNEFKLHRMVMHSRIRYVR